MMGPYLGMQSGRRFYPLAPTEKDIDWRDIAAGVCRIPRFTGQLPLIGDHETYVVGQHLVEGVMLLRARNRSPRTQRAFFGHDMCEGIWGFGDICNPVKTIPEVSAVLRPIEQRVDRVIARALNLDEDELASPMVKQFDAVMLAWETRDLRGSPWFDDLELPPVVMGHVPERILRPWSIGETRERFDAMLRDFGLTEDR